MNEIGYGKANGKIILNGEHAVVYGKPAIALPFNQVQIEAYVYETNGPLTIESSFYQGTLDLKDDDSNVMSGLIYNILTYLKKPHQNIHIKIISSMPSQSGLGSSAALSVAIIKALFNTFKEPLTDTLIKCFAEITERSYHSNPSGLDLETIITNQAVFFQKGIPHKKINMQIKGYLIVADTGKPSQTSKAVKFVALHLSDNPILVNDVFDQIGKISVNMLYYLEHNEINHVGKAMTKAHHLLRKINISDQEIDHLVDVACLNGALGAKLTGSGQGGAMIAIAHTRKDALNIEKALLEAGAKRTWIHDLEERNES